MLRIVSSIFIIAFIIGCNKTFVKETDVRNNNNVQEVVTTTKIDGQLVSTLRSKWEKEFITAFGQAAVVEKYPEVARNRMLAKQGAITDAKRNLAEKINSIEITATTTMADFSTTDFVQTKIKAVLQEVEVIVERFDEKNQIFEVQVQMPKTKLLNILESYSSSR